MRCLFQWFVYVWCVWCIKAGIFHTDIYDQEPRIAFAYVWYKGEEKKKRDTQTIYTHSQNYFKCFHSFGTSVTDSACICDAFEREHTHQFIIISSFSLNFDYSTLSNFVKEAKSVSVMNKMMTAKWFSRDLTFIRDGSENRIIREYEQQQNYQIRSESPKNRLVVFCYIKVMILFGDFVFDPCKSDFIVVDETWSHTHTTVSWLINYIDLWLLCSGLYEWMNSSVNVAFIFNLNFKLSFEHPRWWLASSTCCIIHYLDPIWYDQFEDFLVII